MWKVSNCKTSIEFLKKNIKKENANKLYKRLHILNHNLENAALLLMCNNGQNINKNYLPHIHFYDINSMCY